MTLVDACLSNNLALDESTILQLQIKDESFNCRWAKFRIPTVAQLDKREDDDPTSTFLFGRRPPNNAMYYSYRIAINCVLFHQHLIRIRADPSFKYFELEIRQ